MQRCYRIKEKSYQDYGGRGITVCDRWHDFVNFLADMGEVQAKLTLDRKDNNGNYEPTNCRWATRGQQLRNTRISQFVTHNGVTKSIWDWAEEIGIKGKTLKKRLSGGWDINKAMTTPTLSIKEVSAIGLAKRWNQTP